MPPLDIAAIRAATDIVTLIGRYVELKPAGAEFEALCPFHEERTPSFKVSPAKQIFACFGCGEKGDAFDFLQAHLSIGLREAAAIITGNPAPIPADRPKAARTKAPERRTFAAPDGSRPDMRTRLGDPVATWDYCDQSGALLGVVARFESGGKKTIRCWSWGQFPGDAPQWECRHFATPRPLYGLPRLASKKPGARVILVEGEKTSDAAAILFPANPVLTWPGGAGSVQHVDFSPLAGRDVVLIPDCDPAGVQAMERAAALLYAAGAQSVNGVSPEFLTDGTPAPAGWDLADALAAGWSSADATAWARERMTVYPVPGAEKAPTSDAPAPVVSEPASVPESPGESVIVPMPVSVRPDRPESPDPPQLGVVDGNTIRKPIRREIEAEAALPPEYSEDALAEAFTQSVGEVWRSIPASRVWLKWDGNRWIVDESEAINHVLRIFCRQRAADARDVTLAGRQRMVSVKMGKAIADMVRSDPRHATVTDDWDADDWRLGVPGGSIDLRTGQCEGPKLDYLISRSTSVAPAPGPHPLWDQVVSRASNGDPEYARFLQKWAGLTLSGDTSQEAFLFLHGKGGSGKSTFVDALSEILADYAVTSPIESFTATPKQEHSTEIARLAGARMVTANETSEGSRFNESRIKQLTGRDKIAARFIGKNFIEFKPRFKLWIVGNNRPGLRSVGEEMKRRIHLVEFADSIPESERDPTFKKRLESEFPQILQWAIDGCLAYLAEGLRRPAAVVRDVEQYLQSEDILGSWIEDCADEVAHAREKSADLYRSFSQWAVRNGEYVFPAKRFKQKLIDRGLESVKSNGQQMIVGIRLRLPDTPDYAPPDY